LIASAGIKVKDVIGRGYIFFNIRYSYGLNNIVNSKNRYSNPVLMYNYLYIDNNYKINSFQYSIGYSYPLYKPKLKKVKMKDPLENQ
jgi:Neuraminidase (sialidase)